MRVNSTKLKIILVVCLMIYFFFFQAEDGIRDATVTGVQTCALPISVSPGATASGALPRVTRPGPDCPAGTVTADEPWLVKIGRASCREKSVDIGGGRMIKKKEQKRRTKTKE